MACTAMLAAVMMCSRASPFVRKLAVQLIFKVASSGTTIRQKLDEIEAQHNPEVTIQALRFLAFAFSEICFQFSP